MTDSEAPEAIQEAPVPRTRKSPKAATEKSKYVKALNLYKGTVTITGEDGRLYKLLPREKAVCLRSEVEKSPHLESLE